MTNTIYIHVLDGDCSPAINFICPECETTRPHNIIEGPLHFFLKCKSCGLVNLQELKTEVIKRGLTQ